MYSFRVSCLILFDHLLRAFSSMNLKGKSDLEIKYGLVMDLSLKSCKKHCKQSWNKILLVIFIKLPGELTIEGSRIFKKVSNIQSN